MESVGTRRWATGSLRMLSPQEIREKRRPAVVTVCLDPAVPHGTSKQLSSSYMSQQIPWLLFKPTA